MHFSVGSQKACNGRFRKVPAADDVGALETFPVYYAGERGGPKRRGGEAFCSYIYLLQVLEIRREM